MIAMLLMTWMHQLFQMQPHQLTPEYNKCLWPVSNISLCPFKANELPYQNSKLSQKGGIESIPSVMPVVTHRLPCMQTRETSHTNAVSCQTPRTQRGGGGGTVKT